jgi:hypothetical protein
MDVQEMRNRDVARNRDAVTVYRRAPNGWYCK